MHTFATDDVDGSREGCRYRRDENGEAAIVDLLNDKSRNERVFDLDERRLPDGLAVFPGESLREASKERVTRKSLEERSLHPLSERSAHPRPDGDTDHETDEQHEHERQQTLGR